MQCKLSVLPVFLLLFFTDKETNLFVFEVAFVICGRFSSVLLDVM